MDGRPRFNDPQVAWGPEWGVVQPFVLDSSSQIAVPGPPALDSQEYKEAYDMAKDYGALSTYGPSDTPTSRTAEQTEIGLFWADDRPTMGPPPVLYVRNLEDIAEAVGNSPEQNSRMFALVSTAMADAAITAWDVKFEDNFWRLITAIREGDSDTNPDTIGDADWVPLGAPGSIANDPNDIAEYVYANRFHAVPEPASVLLLCAATAGTMFRRRPAIADLSNRS